MAGIFDSLRTDKRNKISGTISILIRALLLLSAFIKTYCFICALKELYRTEFKYDRNCSLL